MKTISVAACAFALSFAFNSLALATDLEVNGARIDAAGENLLVDITHGGGCAKHVYKLEMKGCAESMPVQCQATVKDMTFDSCEMAIRTTATFNLKDHGIEGSYFSEGSLTIKGASGTSATVRLPEFSETTSTKKPAASSPKVICVTNASSNLEIDEAAGEITLIPVTGEVQTYKITDVEAMSLESNPPVAQTTYSLDDGRKVVIEFRGSEKVGTGYYIRIGGTASPAFKSCIQTR